MEVSYGQSEATVGAGYKRPLRAGAWQVWLAGLPAFRHIWLCGLLPIPRPLKYQASTWVLGQGAKPEVNSSLKCS